MDTLKSRLRVAGADTSGVTTPVVRRVTALLRPTRNREVNEEVTNKSGRSEALFGAAGGATGGCAASAGGAGSALKFPTAGKGKSGHHPTNFFAFAFWTGNLIGSIKY
jgi:hypothetical protein